MNVAAIRPAWLRLPVALVFVLPVYALHVAVPALTDPRVRTAGVLLSAAIAAILGGAAYSLYVRCVERRSVSEFNPTGAPREFIAGFALGGSLFAVTIGILAMLGLYRVVGRNDLAIALVPFFVAVGTAVIEEIIFRGIVFRIIESTLGTWIALILSSGLFGLLHLISPVATLQGAVAIALGFGFMLGAAYLLTGRLWLPIGIHAGWNFTQGGIFGVSVSGYRSNGILYGTLTGPEWLSGGSFGAEASIVAVVLGVALSSVLVVKAWRRGLFMAPHRRQ